MIGVLADTAPLEMVGISTSQQTLGAAFPGRARPTIHYFAVAPGVDPDAAAARLESSFVGRGMEAESIKAVVEDTTAASVTFNRLIQGFMGLGLIVGVAALGVISARAVVERRQQIGVLRAIGFRRRMVQATFLLESSFIALTAIAVGTGLGLLLAYNIVSDQRQQPSWDGLTLVVPWLNLGIIFLVVYLVALAATLAPALRASRIRPAEALRYESTDECRRNLLASGELKAIDAYWRAANYLWVGQIYLLENPLLREPLADEHVKPRLLGHFGTVPGLNLVYIHLNRAIRARDLNAIYVTGPGHGGPAVVANAYLEGTYSELYPQVSRDKAGLRELFRQFSFPGGIPSHAAPETPGSIHEGGELGYALAHAFGAPSTTRICWSPAS